MLKLIVQSGPHPGRVFLPPPGIPVEIGRGAECFVRIAGKSVSRRHAVLVPEGEGYLVRDCGSRNGTFVNGQLVSEKPLRPGDVLRIGEVQIAYVIEEPDPLIGKTVAGFRILERIGCGGTGTVYRALQLSMDRSVALKILSPELSKDLEFVERLQEEARAMGRVSHPHVVEVHTAGREGDLCYLAMEHLEGGSLKDLLKKEGPLSPRRAIRLILDAASALVWAEKENIVHRDIKPGNLLLDARGRVKVADFGLAAELPRSGEIHDPGRVLGSPPFMAPEQALGRPIDPRADLYALACTLYTALTGQHPFEGKTLKEILLAKLREDYRPISKLAPGVPAGLESVVRRALAKEPSHRQQSAAEFERDLERILLKLPEEPAEPRPASPSMRGVEGSWQGEGRRRIARTAALAGAVAASLAVILILWLARPAFLGDTGGRQAEAPPPSKTPSGESTARSDGTHGPAEGGSGATVSPHAPTIVEGVETPDAGSETAPAEPEPGAPGAAPASRGDAGARVVHGESGSLPPGLEEGPPRSGSGPPSTPEGGLEQDLAALRDMVASRIQPLLLESRFDEATTTLEIFSKDRPSTATETAREVARVRAAKDLFSTREKALELERRGSLDEAIGALEASLGRLPPRYRREAEEAIRSIREKKAAR